MKRQTARVALLIVETLIGLTGVAVQELTRAVKPFSAYLAVH